MTNNDSGLQDGTIPLLTEVLEGNAAPVSAPPARMPASSPVPATSAQPAPAARPAMHVAPAERGMSDDEAGIPVLTVPLPAAAVPSPVRPRPASPQTTVAAAPVTPQPGIQRPAEPVEGAVDAMLARLSPEEMEQLQHKLSERILRQLQSRIDFVLEQRVRDSLADVLQLAMGGLTNDIKRGLQHTLEEVVGRAVSQEIARLQSGKK